MASIRKRGKSWEVRVRRQGKTVCRTFDSKAEADAYAGQMESKILRGTFISQKEAERTTLSEALERFIHDYIQERMAHTKRDANRARALQKRDISRYPLAKLRGKDLSDFIRERETEGAAANTIRLELAQISRLFEVARKDWGMEGLVNPVKNVSKPKLPKGRERRLKHGEENKLLDAAPKEFQYVLRFALETAMRRSEIAEMTWDNVNLKTRTVYLPNTKNGEARSVPLSPKALNILENIPRNITGSVFNMSPDAITKTMRTTRQLAKIEDLTFHDLRHEAISRFFEETDLDAMEIASISGHKTMQMLKRYSHLRVHKLADRLAGAKRGSA